MCFFPVLANVSFQPLFLGHSQCSSSSQYTHWFFPSLGHGLLFCSLALLFSISAARTCSICASCLSRILVKFCHAFVSLFVLSFLPFFFLSLSSLPLLFPFYYIPFLPLQLSPLVSFPLNILGTVTFSCYSLLPDLHRLDDSLLCFFRLQVLWRELSKSHNEPIQVGSRAFI